MGENRGKLRSIAQYFTMEKGQRGGRKQKLGGKFKHPPPPRSTPLTTSVNSVLGRAATSYAHLIVGKCRIAPL